MSASVCTAVSALFVMGLPEQAPTEPVARVSLTEQQAELDVGGGAPRLRAKLVVESHLPVSVSQVEIGILYAEEATALEVVDPGALYQAPDQANKRVGAVRKLVAVSLAAGAQVPVDFEAAVLPAGPRAQAFRAHVLGYGLEEASATLLFELLGTSGAADEVAAVDFLALRGTTAAKWAARKRWGGSAELVAAFAAELGSAPPARPSEQEVFRRVYAARALGVLGGARAEKALTALLREPTLAAFDEPLQLLRIGRFAGSRLQTPLAFAVPVQARRMHDVLTAALHDTTDLQPLAVEVGQQSGTVQSPPELDAGASDKSKEPVTSVPVAVAVAILLALVLGWFLGQRGRRARSDADRGA